MSIEMRIEKLEAAIKPQTEQALAPVIPDDPVAAARVYAEYIRESPGVSVPMRDGPAITPEEAERVYREFMHGSS